MSTRRKFITHMAGAGLATSFFPTSCVAKQSEKKQPAPVPVPTEIIKPKRLKKGDTIGLIAPGYALKPKVVQSAENTLKRLGFKVYYTNRMEGNYGYLSNTDEERIADIHELFADPKIDGILCARGGYGCTRILNQLDFELIKNNPKVLIGFSDITALLNGIYKETGLITFHGPVGSTLNDPYSIKQLTNIVINPKQNYVIKNAVLTDKKYLQNPEYDRYTITPGTATGKLVGGSLTLINALVGTPQEVDFTNAIVCIEDIEEAPYRIDRMLTQLINGPTFKKAAGIAIGVCAGCNTSTNPLSFTLKEVLVDLLKPLNIPCIYGMSFGHVPQNFTFPVGIEATLNVDAKTITLLEEAVV